MIMRIIKNMINSVSISFSIRMAYTIKATYCIIDFTIQYLCLSLTSQFIFYKLEAYPKMNPNYK